MHDKHGSTMLDLAYCGMEISAFSYTTKCTKSRPSLVNNRPNKKKLLDMFYPNKKGLNRPKTISRYCPLKVKVSLIRKKPEKTLER
jgi:hypothetical protein